jgi:chemotaxis protein MotA
VDIASIIGFIAGIAFIVSSITANGELGTFIDMSSVYITIGGTFSATLISYPIQAFIGSFKSAKHIFSVKELHPEIIIQKIITLANTARKEGLLALEEAAKDIDDDFLKKGVLLIVDGTDPELVRNILETELSFLDERHKEAQTFWETVASLGPAWGMIGTLIGLINMLKKLDDPSAIGPSMSVALITTMYGSMLANFIATPIANKLKIRSNEEVLVKDVMIEGLLSIQAGENPRIIEEKLKAFLAPALRKAQGNEKDGAAETAEA